MPNEKIETRQNEILLFIKSNGEVTLDHICRNLNLSVSTVRRDVRKLRESKEIVKIGKELYTALQMLNSHPLLDKHSTIFEKLAESVINTFTESDILFIGSGKNNNYLCDGLIKSKSSFTLITSNVNHASILRRQNQHGVYLLGGEIRPTTGDVDGTLAINMLREYRLDVAVFTCRSIISDRGIFLDGYSDYSLIKTVIEQSRKVIVIAEKECFDRPTSGAILPFSLVSTIYTEKAVDPLYINQLLNKGIKIIQV